MKFSIVIPTYNRALFIAELLQSLSNQSINDFEVLVCDDGSTDNTQEVVQSFVNQLKIRYFYNENWGGPAHPRNVGIKNAVGEWVCFLDSDDLWYANKLESVSSVIKDDIDVIYHLFSTNSKKKSTIGLYKVPVFRDLFEDLLTNGNKIVNSSLVIRKQLLLDIGGLSEDENLIGVEDYDLTIRLARKKVKFYFLNQVLGEYRINDTNISSDYVKQVKKVTYLLQQYEKDVNPKIQLRMKALINYLMASHFISNKEFALARSSFYFSFKFGSFQIKFKSLIKMFLIYSRIR
jgi:glycosyltransferase involved in cell wall biosynthesis